MRTYLKRKICISAYNIHQGGGRTVLLAFLKNFLSGNDEVTCYIDKRLQIDFKNFKNINFVEISPSIVDRLKAEFFYKKHASQYDAIYFFGNLPPIFKLKSQVILFLQNRLMLTSSLNTLFPLRSFAKKIIEKIWFMFFMKNVDVVEVQTPTMRQEFHKLFPSKKVVIENYIDLAELAEFKNKFITMNLPKEKNSFVYICSLEKHKNIKNLLLAFAQLSPDSYRLYINLHKGDALYSLAKELNVSIYLIPSIDRETILRSIYCSEFLIYPSLIESLGLPLIEARELGTKIIAANLDYVFDVCTPNGVFDARSVKSIADAVKQQLPWNNYNE